MKKSVLMNLIKDLPDDTEVFIIDGEVSYTTETEPRVLDYSKDSNPYWMDFN